MKDLFVTSIRLKDDIENKNKYPFNIKCLKNFKELELNKNVTFLCGENGVGKSTFIEAIAIALGLNPEGGSNNMNFSNYDDYSPLYKYLVISKFKTPKTKFFLRAESYFNVASEISNNNIISPLSLQYGGDPHECSHGESFIKLVENRFWNNGLYILDEPEAALSPARQMTLLCHIDRLAKNGSQFIIATHSPILLAYRDAEIIDLNNDMKKVSYEETDTFKIYKDFLNDPLSMQERLFDKE